MNIRRVIEREIIIVLSIFIITTTINAQNGNQTITSVCGDFSYPSNELVLNNNNIIFKITDSYVLKQVEDWSATEYEYYTVFEMEITNFTSDSVSLYDGDLSLRLIKDNSIFSYQSDTELMRRIKDAKYGSTREYPGRNIPLVSTFSIPSCGSKLSFAAFTLPLEDFNVLETAFSSRNLTPTTVRFFLMRLLTTDEEQASSPILKLSSNDGTMPKIIDSPHRITPLGSEKIETEPSQMSQEFNRCEAVSPDSVEIVTVQQEKFTYVKDFGIGGGINTGDSLNINFLPNPNNATSESYPANLGTKFIKGLIGLLATQITLQVNYKTQEEFEKFKETTKKIQLTIKPSYITYYSVSFKKLTYEETVKVQIGDQVIEINYSVTEATLLDGKSETSCTKETPSQIPTITEITALPQYGFVTVNPSVVNLRDSICIVRGEAYKGDEFPIIERDNTDPVWYLVGLRDGRQLWISSTIVTLNDNIDNIPLSDTNLGVCVAATQRPLPTSTSMPIPTSPSRLPEISNSWTNNACPIFSTYVNWSDPDGDIDHIIAAWGPDINNNKDGAEAKPYSVNSSLTSGTWQSTVHLECTNPSGDGCNVRFQAVDKQGNTSSISRAYNTCP